MTTCTSLRLPALYSPSPAALSASCRRRDFKQRRPWARTDSHYAHLQQGPTQHTNVFKTQKCYSENAKVYRTRLDDMSDCLRKTAASVSECVAHRCHKSNRLPRSSQRCSSFARDHRTRSRTQPGVRRVISALLFAFAASQFFSASLRLSPRFIRRTFVLYSIDVSNCCCEGRGPSPSAMDSIGDTPRRLARDRNKSDRRLFSTCDRNKRR